MNLLARRLRAAELFDAGRSQARVALELGVTRTTAMRWYRIWLAGGRRGLALVGHAGRPPKANVRDVEQVLARLPRDTCLESVADAIERGTGTRYHPAHLSRVLGAWGWRGSHRPPTRIPLHDPDANAIFLYSGE